MKGKNSSEKEKLLKYEMEREGYMSTYRKQIKILKHRKYIKGEDKFKKRWN